MTPLAKKKIEEAKRLKSKSLNLGKCGLETIPDEVLEMTWLEELILSNRFWDKEKNFWREEEFGNLNKIRKLPNDLGKLNQLNSLKIQGDYNYGFYNISNIFEIKNLINLTSLDIRYNNISDASFLKNLTNLSSLNIGYNKKIKDYGFLKNLTNLNSLNIRYNNINDASFLKNLTNLNSLNISDNTISDASFLKNLINLSSLDIRFNNVSDASFLKNLTNLNSLNISYNNVSDASFLKNLTNLSSLDIRSNNISDTSFLKNLTNLSSLDISSNNIRDASFLKNLTNLSSLDISNNNISNTSFLKKLTNLNSLVINNNSIQDFQDFLPLIKRGLPIKLKFGASRFGIYIKENPWSTPPLEILKNGNEAVLEYFSELKKHGEEHLSEAKMIVVGKGGVGKTSLIEKLLDRHANLPEEEETTKGIDIKCTSFTNDENKEFTINIWDFGGQEIYHATHQFFLTERSLYVLVDDTKDDDKTVNDASFKYWLQVVELFGDNSPLLIFQNEKGGRSKDLDLKSMRARFDFIQERHSDDLISPKEGLDRFEKAVQYFVQRLPHIGQVLPSQWINIRKELLRMSVDHYYITADKFFEICTKHDIDETSKMLNLSKYLHDLGTFLHFQNDDLLRKTIILQNEWATDAVYKVLDDEDVKKNSGVVTRKKAVSIWKESKYVNMHPELLALMMKFEICYQIDSKKDTYLIPQLLPESRPDTFEWNNENNLQLKYSYEFLPKGLLSRFMVRMSPYLKDLTKSWKRGVVLEKDNAYAFIEEKYGINKIGIRISGTNQKEFMIVIKEQFDRLNKSYEGITVEKLIPCNCETCEKLQTPHFFKYTNLVERFREHKETIGCDNKPYNDVRVTSLLFNFIDNRGFDFDHEKAHSDFSSRPKYVAETMNFYPNANIKTSNINADGDKVVAIGNENEAIDVSANDQDFNADTASSSSASEHSMLSEWWVKRLIGAFTAGLFAMIVAGWFEFSHPFSAFLIVFPLLATLLLYIGNPARRFFRAALTAFGAAMSVFILQLGFKFEWSQKVKDGNFKLALEWLTEYDWLIGLCILLLSGVLFYMDWKNDEK